MCISTVGVCAPILIITNILSTSNSILYPEPSTKQAFVDTYIPNKEKPLVYASKPQFAKINGMISKSRKERLSLRHSFGILDYPDEKWVKMLPQIFLNRQIQLNKTQTSFTQPCINNDNCPTGNSEAWGYVAVKYEPTLPCIFAQRLGKTNDGGKWVCDAYHIAELNECNVISVGSNNDWSFEIEIHKLNPHCKIYTLDHTIQPIQKPEFVQWWPIGISDYNQGQFSTISTAVEYIGLSGKKIDILKIDCEGCEYRVFQTIDLKQLQIHQLLIELHAVSLYKYKKGMYGITMNTIDNLIDNISKSGYDIFHNEKNGACCAEIAFIKMNYTLYK